MAVVENWFISPKTRLIQNGGIGIIPVVLYVEMQDSGYRIVGYRDGGLGGQYLSDYFSPAIIKLNVLGNDSLPAFNKRLNDKIGVVEAEAHGYFANYFPTSYPQ